MLVLPSIAFDYGCKTFERVWIRQLLLKLVKGDNSYDEIFVLQTDGTVVIKESLSDLLR